MIRTKSSEEPGLALALIQIDGGTQSRATLNDQVVGDYAEAIQAGVTFPPIVVFYDGKKHWLADGFHRFHAYQKAGREKVAADVRQGTRRDAILHSVGANETHGLRRTNDDKRRAVLTLLGDAEWSAKPERWIAATAHVSHTFVQKVRAAHLATLPDRPAEKQVERGGATYPMKTAGINASRATNFRAENVQVDAADHQKENAVEFVAAQGFDPADRPVAASAEFAQPRNIFDELVSLWKEADAGVRQDFKAYITGSEFVAKFNLTEGNPAPDTGGSDVDRSAERASSAVEVGATNSPDGAVFRSRVVWSQLHEGGRILAKIGEIEVGAVFPEEKGCTWSFWLGTINGPHKKAKSVEVAKAAIEKLFLERTGLTAPDGANEAEEVHLTGRGTRERGEHGANRRNGGAVERRIREGSPAGEAEDASVTSSGGENPATNSHSQPVASDQLAVAKPADTAAAETSPVPYPSAAANPIKVLSRVEQVLLIRPHCQHPGTDQCGGSGRNLCHSCKKLMAESEAA